MDTEIHTKLYDVARQARQLQSHLRRVLSAGRETNEVVVKLGLYSLVVLGGLARQAESLADLVLAIQGITGRENT